MYFRGRRAIAIEDTQQLGEHTECVLLDQLLFLFDEAVGYSPPGLLNNIFRLTELKHELKSQQTS